MGKKEPVVELLHRRAAAAIVVEPGAIALASGKDERHVESPERGELGTHAMRMIRLIDLSDRERLRTVAALVARTPGPPNGRRAHADPGPAPGVVLGHVLAALAAIGRLRDLAQAPAPRRSLPEEIYRQDRPDLRRDFETRVGG
jgi:hypothetical protein